MFNMRQMYCFIKFKMYKERFIVNSLTNAGSGRGFLVLFIEILV